MTALVWYSAWFKSRYKRNLVVLAALNVFRNAYMYMPILAACVQSRLLDVAVVAELFVISQATTFVFEIVTGFIADRKSRKFSMVIGGVICAVGMVVWAGAGTNNAFYAGAFLLGLGHSFMFGADTSILYETLKRWLPSGLLERKFEHTNATMRGWATGSEATCSVIAGLLITFAGFSFAHVMLLQAVFYVVTACLALAIYEERPQKIALKQMFKTAFGRRDILAITLFSGTASGLSLVLVWWTAPFYLKVLGAPSLWFVRPDWVLSPTVSFAVAWFLFLWSVPFWAWLLRKPTEKYPVASLWALVGVSIVCYVWLTASPSVLSFWLIGLTYMPRAKILPAAERFLNQRLQDGERATVNSVSRCFMLLISSVMYGVSVIVEHQTGSVVAAIAVAAAVNTTLVIGSLCWLLYVGAHRDIT